MMLARRRFCCWAVGTGAAVRQGARHADRVQLPDGSPHRPVCRERAQQDALGRQAARHGRGPGRPACQVQPPGADICQPAASHAVQVLIHPLQNCQLSAGGALAAISNWWVQGRSCSITSGGTVRRERQRHRAQPPRPCRLPQAEFFEAAAGNPRPQPASSTGTAEAVPFIMQKLPLPDADQTKFTDRYQLGHSRNVK